MTNRSHPVAVEGYPFIGLFAFVTLVFAALHWVFLALLFLLLTFFCIYFFRDPERMVPQDERAVIAPADGKIVYVGKVTEDRFLGGEALKVSIFMSVFNVHVNRAPFRAKVLDSFYRRGSFVNAALDQASVENEQAGLLLEAPTGAKVLCVQIAGLIARRIVSYPQAGDELLAGQRYGLIRFGSRVDLYLPVDTQLRVAQGETTSAGETVLGLLP